MPGVLATARGRSSSLRSARGGRALGRCSNDRDINWIPSDHPRSVNCQFSVFRQSSILRYFDHGFCFVFDEAIAVLKFIVHVILVNETK